MKKILLVFIIATAIVSCNVKEKTPEYIIPAEDMTNIILDIHLTDGILTLSNIRRDLAQKDTIDYYDHIFKNYGYTRADFDTSVYYYSMNINEYDEIYAEVLNKLNEMETKLKEENAEEKKVPQKLNEKEKE